MAGVAPILYPGAEQEEPREKVVEEQMTIDVSAALDTDSCLIDELLTVEEREIRDKVVQP